MLVLNVGETRTAVAPAATVAASIFLAAAILSTPTTPHVTPKASLNALSQASHNTLRFHFREKKVLRSGSEVRPVRSEARLQDPHMRQLSDMTGQQDVLMLPPDPRYFFQ